jgi:hypothetical protein
MGLTTFHCTSVLAYNEAVGGFFGSVLIRSLSIALISKTKKIVKF